ncbi:PASTA domain-containing protein [bacterium]|nr:PASTA domain-containing protein [bacterium]
MSSSNLLRNIGAWAVRIGIILGVWVVFVLFLNQVVMPIYIRNWSEITVPDLRGMTQEEAEKVAKKGHVKVFVQDERFEAEIEQGTVLEQFPLPGVEAKPGRRIHVIVAAGTPMTDVPYVVGMARESAVMQMEAQGLVVDSIYYAFSDSVFENQVMSQIPDSGVVLQRESPTEITVSLGKEPRQYVVPDVLDLPFEQARYLILKSGLRVGSVTYDKYVGRRKGAVMNQIPAPKSNVQRRSRVRLEVNYPEGWVHPDTLRARAEAARADSLTVLNGD